MRHRLIWFIHCHKCAGSSLVNLLITSGYIPYPYNINGNPTDSSGRLLDFSSFDKKQLDVFIDQAIDSGVSLICSEFSHPSIKDLGERGDIVVATIIRNPVSRIWSNWSFDYLMSYRSSQISIGKWLQQDFSWCSPSYFVDTFSQSCKSSLHSRPTLMSAAVPDSESPYHTRAQMALQNLHSHVVYAVQEDSVSMQRLSHFLGAVSQVGYSNKSFSLLRLAKDIVRLRFVRIFKSFRVMLLKASANQFEQRSLGAIGYRESELLCEDLYFYGEACKMLGNNSF